MTRQKTPRLLVALAALLAAASITTSIAWGGTLSDIPLSIKGSVPPNVMFALSVEFPTANTAAYQDTGSYSVNNQYLGYFDDGKCYRYDSTNGWFYPVYTTTTHLCTSGGWSGNLLNWATMTGLDEFRFAMTGGNRSTDTASATILERSYQSGQGGTSNFPDKTFTDTDSYSTTYPAGTALTFQNQGRGIQVAITPTSSVGVLNCSSPTLSGSTFSCTMTTATGASGACFWWVGNGTSASPYTCTSMQIGGEVPTTFSAVTPPSSSSAGGSGTTVTCSSPSITGSTFSCGSITLSNGSTATCNTWTGDGTAANPYTCTSFSSFSNGETFYQSGAPTAASFSTTTQVTGIVEPSNSSYMTCNMSSGPTLTCSLSTGSSAKCSTFSANKRSKYSCTGFGSTGSETITTFSNDGSSTTSYNSLTYYNKYQLTYSKPITSTVYYASTYPGTTNGYYYTSSYNYGFSGSQVYNVRVKVCDSNVGLEDNCKLYGSTYKPTGVIQDNGDKMRFGVTSYFNANDVDNAVLRSKAKYVAPLKYSPSGTYTTNALSEWSSADGTLITNPDATDSATSNSYVGTMSNTGVINYINKFGSTSHSYKTYDVVGKLYYETLKYLRGTKSPTTSFYNGAKSSNADGFPVINQWDDPVLYSCQKNYIVTMGDTHTWCDKKLPGGTYGSVGSTACNAYTDGNANSHTQDTGALSGDTGVDVTVQTNKVGTLEGATNLATTLTGAGSSASYSMAGLSQWAASQDIRTDLVGKQTVKTYVIDVEENKDCGYNSQFWYTAKYGNPASYDSNGNWLTTGNPWSSSITLPGGACSSRAPTGYNSAGGAVTWPADLLRAADPMGMIASVRSAITDIVAQIGDEAALAQSSGFLDTGTGAYIYRAIYNSGGWTGDVQALTIGTDGSISATPAWTAAANLPSAANRKVFTFNDGYAANGTAETSANARRGVAFTNAGFGNLSSRQQALLNTDATGSSDALGADRINYLRGDQSKEAFLPGTTTANPNPNYGWRTRNSTALLGDVINSNPAYVGPPNSGYSSATYKAFATAHASRSPLVYVGGNDGMLHAYDASFTYDANGTPQTVNNASNVSGKEVFAYVPGAVYGKLSQLMSPNYSHKYFVDGSPTIGDACFGTCTATTDWKTVLVGGLNAGGQGVYALDVTDPIGGFTASNVLWEFTDLDDADIGYTFSRPIIRKLNNGKWAAIFGNGYNNTAADGAASTTGRAALFILYLDGPGAGNRWTLGTNYFKIVLPSPTEGSTPVLPQSPANGLSAVSSLDTDLNGTVDYIYTGDRYGNLWKIDLTNSDPTHWASAFNDGATPVSKPLPLFTAKDASGSTQQITTGIAIAPAGTGRPGYMVIFGTGSWVDTADPVGPYQTNALYGIWDTPLVDTSTSTATTYTTPVSGRSSLQQQKVLLYVDAAGNTADSNNVPYTATSVANGQPVYAVYSNCEPYYLTSFDKTHPPTMPNNLNAPLCPSSIAIGTTKTGTQRGWYMDLTAETGERIRSSIPSLSNQASQVTFTTLSPATDPCSGNTIGLEYNLAVETGGMPRNGVYVNSAGGTAAVAATAFSGYTGSGTVKVVLGGTAIIGGASDNAISFNAKPPSSVMASPTGVNPPTASCTGAACANFIPGWGFLMNMQGATAANSNVVLSCSPPEFGTGLPNCVWKYKNGTFGRLSWRQVTH